MPKAKRKAKPAWLEELDIHGRILALLVSAQSRYHTVIVSRLRNRWTEQQVERAIQELLHKQSIEHDSFGRVRWRVTLQGRNEARRAREAAERAVQKKAAAA